MKKSYNKKLNKGFTIAELLLVVAILSVVLSAITIGVSAAMRQYKSGMRRAQTDILYSTLYESICAELRSGSDYKVNEDTKELEHYHSRILNTTGNITTKNINEDGTISDDADGVIYFANIPLISTNAYQDGVKAHLEPITYDETEKLFTVELELIIDNGDGDEYVKAHTFKVNPLNL